MRQVSEILNPPTTKINEVVKLRKHIKSQMEGSYITLAERSAKTGTSLGGGKCRAGHAQTAPTTCCNQGSAIGSTYAAL